MSTVQDPIVSEENLQALSPADIDSIRQDFPVLRVRPHGKPLVYLDNAATSQKPQAVLDVLNRYYAETNANVHRGVHYLSQEATDAFEGARHTIRKFLNAPIPCEIIFTRGTTDAINLVAQAYGRKFIGDGDEILVTHMEHHSNIVPWQMLCEQTGAVLKVAPINDDGEVILEEYENLLNERTKMVAVVHVSNALGTVNPIKKMTTMAHEKGAVVLVDAAQSLPHMAVDVQDLDCDFLALSSHKMYGPTGFGVLFGNAKLLAEMDPYQGGGDMIRSVTFEETLYNDLPYKFEAGTPHIAGAIGLAAAIEYLNGIGMERIAAYEHDLMAYGAEALQAIEGVRLIGTANDRAGALSFVMDDAHPHDIGQLVDEEGVAIRTGHHCAQPVMDRFNVSATARASFAVYNTKDDIDTLVSAIYKVKEVFA
jgi:cysteine desulfurase/selenocysteine lyase